MRTWILTATLCACTLPDRPGAELPRFDPIEVEILEVSWQCSEDRWSLDVAVQGLSAGGALWLTQDGRYAEVHEVPTIASAPDGSREELRLRLTAIADWRAVRPGQSTAFTCASPADGLFAVRDAQGEFVACAALGEQQRWASLEGLPDCG